MTPRDLRGWLTKGDLALRAAAASDIASALFRLALCFRRPLLIGEFEDFFRNPEAEEASVVRLISGTLARFSQFVAPRAARRRGDQMARVPWTTDEVKACLQGRHREEEAKAIRLLSLLESAACGVYWTLALG